jgi:hypothetical protein
MISATVSKQWKMVRMTAELIKFVEKHNDLYGENDWAITFGEAFRSSMLAQMYAKMGIGIANSKHTERRAIDVNFFIGGVYQDKSEAYLPLGTYWESLGGVWGGRFKKADGNHFEV